MMLTARDTNVGPAWYVVGYPRQGGPRVLHQCRTEDDAWRTAATLALFLEGYHAIRVEAAGQAPPEPPTQPETAMQSYRPRYLDPEQAEYVREEQLHAARLRDGHRPCADCDQWKPPEELRRCRECGDYVCLACDAGQGTVNSDGTWTCYSCAETDDPETWTADTCVTFVPPELLPEGVRLAE